MTWVVKLDGPPMMTETEKLFWIYMSMYSLFRVILLFSETRKNVLKSQPMRAFSVKIVRCKLQSCNLYNKENQTQNVKKIVNQTQFFWFVVEFYFVRKVKFYSTEFEFFSNFRFLSTHLYHFIFRILQH